MDYRALLVQELIKITKTWVDANGYASKDGVVCIFNGKVQGWVKELPDPADWRPGVYAVSKEDVFLAVGGDNVDGAKEWTQI